MGWCDRDFFGEDDESEHIWNSWNDTLIICPKIPQGEEPQLEDDGHQMVSKHIYINFDRCQNSTSKSICKSE